MQNLHFHEAESEYNQITGISTLLILLGNW